ncbi:MAG: amidophosphoribosyltransferase [Thermoproteota archaeon]
MGGLFGVVSNDLPRDLFFGVDYHSHLGTEVGGIAFLDEDIEVISQDISNSQFKSEFQKDYARIKGRLGIGVISDLEEGQPIKFESKIGTFALCTTGLVRNARDLYFELIDSGTTLKRSRVKQGGTVLNQTEIVGELISKGKDVVDGIEKMHKKIEGYISLLLLLKEERSIYATGDVFPLIVGRRGEDWALASETTAFPNLGYSIYKFLQYREIVSISESGVRTIAEAPKDRKFCPFLHVYYGFPTSDYYGINAEIVRERCGSFLTENDDVKADLVLGIADSGFAHSIGYVMRKIEFAKEKISEALEKHRRGEIGASALEDTIKKALGSMPPLRRPLVKYAPGWGRSYIPPTQNKRELIAKHKQIPNPQIIKGMSIILIDDSIRRGTQLHDLLKEKIWPCQPREIHGRIASPPQMFPCILDPSTKNQDLATRKAIIRIEGRDVEDVSEYMDPNNPKYERMVEEIRKMIGFTTLKYQTLEDMIKAVIEAPNNKGLRREDLCLYCWTGKI